MAPTVSPAKAFAVALRAHAVDEAVAGVRALEASTELRTLRATMERALHGSRPAVRVYVETYRRLVRRVLEAARDSYPEHVVGGADDPALVDGLARPSAIALLEEGAVAAPFSVWVNAFGAPHGLVLELVSRVREALPDVDPIALPAGTTLPDWNVDDSAVLAFIAAVRRELAVPPTPLDAVAEGFGLNDTELGGLFGVRRQAVSQWRVQGIPAARAEKVATVASLADLLTRKLKAERLPGIARRPAEAYDGLAMLEMIAADRHDELLDLVHGAFDFSRTG